MLLFCFSMESNEVLRLGTGEAGLAVFVDVGSRTITARVWGFLNPELSRSLSIRLINVLKNAPRGFTLTVDASRLLPMRDEAQASFGALMNALPSLGILSASIITGSQVTKLQLLRLVKAHSPAGLVKFVPLPGAPVDRH